MKNFEDEVDLTSWPISPAGAVLRLHTLGVTLPRVTAMVGDRTVSTLREVAEEFGRSPNTISGSWRNGGMPGSPGKWHLPTIAMWRYRHEAMLDGCDDPYDWQGELIEQMAERNAKLEAKPAKKTKKTTRKTK